MKFNLRKNRRQRRGFTLMEVLVVMAILVVLAATVTFAYTRFFKNAKVDNTHRQIVILKQACDAYKLRMGMYPNQLTDLLAPPAGVSRMKWGGPYLETTDEPLDGWNRQFKYGVDQANDMVVITSFGADGQEGTEDDISNRSKSTY